MQANKSRDTGPEMALRRELFRRGLRYRVGLAPLPGIRRTIDIAFPGKKIAVMVDGCFWHGCPEHWTLSKHHSEYWENKIRENTQRDTSTNEMLSKAGWHVIRLWEHESVTTMADTVERAVRQKTQQS